ncbi:MAG: diguanylate cyclase, partial [Nitrospirae bacterium]|nr:diguanylate cyclase [Nitrospirota bacterium]
DMSISYKGIPSYITYKKIPEESDNLNKWSIGIMTPEETIYAGISVRKYLFFDLPASIVLLTIAGILGWRISRPIRQITSASMAMSHGDLASRVNLRREDEIGQLADTFNEMAASIQSSHEELTRLSSTDGLTGLYNHREFQKRLEGEISRASRYASPLSLLMMDIDYFKKVNDTYGHPSGDTILRSIGTVILQEIRGSDLAARYGGEEMTVILPETGSSNAFTFAERIRKKIHEIPMTVLAGETIHVTVSIGVASFPGDAHDREGLIDTADQALYFAKEKGRNRTILYGETIKAFLEKEPVKAETLMEQAEEWLFKDLATSVEARLPFRRGHFNAVTRTALQIARSLQFGDEEIKELRIASTLYGVGALNIPANILLKQGALTQEEWDVVKKIPDLSVQILTKILKIQNVLPAIRHHHERYDGTGYPSGLKGEEIPLMARIISVVDAYHAMTTATPYRRKMTHEEAMGVLKDNSGTQFDPNIVEVFIRNLEHKKDKAPDLENDAT